jgi:hypothetical protein
VRTIGEPLQRTLPDQILDHEGEAGKLDQWTGGKIRREQVYRLTRARATLPRERPQALRINAAIGIEHDDDIGRVVS